jgi:DNA-binding transcriptional MocR family regulator
MEEALTRHMPEGTNWTRPEGGMCLWVTLPTGLDATELQIHVQERGVLFAPGRYFYFQNPAPNTLRLGFAASDERQIQRGISIFGQVLRAEMRKRQRGARHAADRVAFI